MDESRLSAISQANTDEQIGDFWDTHDFTDFDNPDAPDVAFEFGHVVLIEAELFTAIKRQAIQRGLQIETLVNLWLQQKLHEQAEKVVA
jgi:hypothetical protein